MQFAPFAGFCGRTHTLQRSTRPRLRQMGKSTFVFCVSCVFHAVSSLPMSLPSRKTAKFGETFNARIHAGAAFKEFTFSTESVKEALVHFLQ
ncbi:hypothetical protein Y032_0090g2404 [Ancylostoma ceylanicum]|uniref:Uncharacterized protein n=1 Tax=Ancylostoma ceylanicum TaxID=53326 RepID=A0A016TN21_9BILA|nr:hypothetical protein Y032_0090g2404 [Ancylostoma ceylanicum]